MGRHALFKRLRRNSIPCPICLLPLKTQSGILGTITFISVHSSHAYTVEDLTMAEELASRVALAIVNARLFIESQHAVRLRDDVLSIASHELKGPLMPLKLQIHLLSKFADEGNAGPPLRVIRSVRAAKIRRTLQNEMEVFRSVPGYVMYQSKAIRKEGMTQTEGNSAITLAGLTPRFDVAWAQAQWEFDGPRREFDGGMRTTDDPGDNFAIRPYIIRTQFVTVLYNEALANILEVGFSERSLSVRVGTSAPTCVRYV
jgi:hypothetical protein